MGQNLTWWAVALILAERRAGELIRQVERARDSQGLTVNAGPKWYRSENRRPLADDDRVSPVLTTRGRRVFARVRDPGSAMSG